MADEPSPGVPRLLLLPRELRNNIYHHLFDWPEETLLMQTITRGEAHPTDQRPFLYTEILSTCRQNLTEAVPLFFAALSNTKLYLLFNVAVLKAPARAFLGRYGSAFQYIKVEEDDFERGFLEQSLFSGLRTLEIRLPVWADMDFGTWEHLDKADHRKDRCETQLQGACIENAIWKEWDAFLEKQYEEEEGSYSYPYTTRFLDSKFGQDRDFGLVASTGLHIRDDDDPVFLIVSPAHALKEVVTNEIRSLHLIWTRERC